MLYEKYRPTKFEDVIGQGANAEILRYQVQTGKIAHTYLMCGNRGSGKTTTARIFAKAINCENPVNGEPCGACDSCKSIDNGTSTDVIEIDAASNNGVDQIREIKNSMNYKPVDAKYKVYILDEAHMLSKSAFNALLKTLEEPPAYGVFILCTTEETALPITVLSRCQRYNYKHISQEDIAKRLKYIADSEGYVPENQDKILTLLAKMSDGAVRDGISLLEQVINGNLTDYDEIVKLLGIISNENIFKLLGLIYSGNSSKAIELLYKALEEGVDIEKFIMNLVNVLRAISIVKTGASTNLIKMTEGDLKLVKLAATSFNTNSLFTMIDILQKTYSEIKISAFKGVLLEMAILKICETLKVQEVKNEPIHTTNNINQVDAAELEKTIRAKLEPKIREEVMNELQPQLQEAIVVLRKKIIEEETVKIREQVTKEMSVQMEEALRLKERQNAELRQAEIERAKINQFKVAIKEAQNRLVKTCESKGLTSPVYKEIAKAFKNSTFIKQNGVNKLLICSSKEYEKILRTALSSEKIKRAFSSYFIIGGIEYELDVQ